MKVKFDSAFIEFRMRHHRHWQRRETERLTDEIFAEVVRALAARTITPSETSGVLPFPESQAVRQSVRTRQ
jgi:hypothetical protein